MSVLYFLLPLALVIAAVAVAAFVWAVRHGQYDDTDSPPLRAILDDDEPSRRPGPRVERKSAGADCAEDV